jgi:transposase
LAISNLLRGILAEFGIVMARSDTTLRRVLADLDVYTELPAECKELLRAANAHWEQVRRAHDACEARITAHARGDARCVRVRAPTGIGPLTADAMVATVGMPGSVPSVAEAMPICAPC